MTCVGSEYRAMSGTYDNSLVCLLRVVFPPFPRFWNSRACHNIHGHIEVIFHKFYLSLVFNGARQIYCFRAPGRQFSCTRHLSRIKDLYRNVWNISIRLQSVECTRLRELPLSVLALNHSTNWAKWHSAQ